MLRYKQYLCTLPRAKHDCDNDTVLPTNKLYDARSVSCTTLHKKNKDDFIIIE